MADPISIVGVCVIALKAISQAKDFVDNIQRAPRTVQNLAADLKAIEELLQELGALLEDSDAATKEGVRRWVQTAQTNCEAIMKDVDKLLRPYVRPDKTPNVTVWKTFTLTFRNGDVVKLQGDMASCKQTLNLAIACAGFAATRKIDRGMRRLQKHFGVATSSVAATDILERNAEMTEEWVAQSTIIVEEEVSADSTEDVWLDSEIREHQDVSTSTSSTPSLGEEVSSAQEEEILVEDVSDAANRTPYAVPAGRNTPVMKDVLPKKPAAPSLEGVLFSWEELEGSFTRSIRRASASNFSLREDQTNDRRHTKGPRMTKALKVVKSISPPAGRVLVNTLQDEDRKVPFGQNAIIRNAVSTASKIISTEDPSPNPPAHIADSSFKALNRIPREVPRQPAADRIYSVSKDEVSREALNLRRINHFEVPYGNLVGFGTPISHDTLKWLMNYSSQQKGNRSEWWPSGGHSTY